MSVTVQPQQFSFVNFDAGLIERVAVGMAEAIGIDRPVHIEVDESTPLGRVEIEIGPTVVIRAQSGALEDSRRPRQQSEMATTATISIRVKPRVNGFMNGVMAWCQGLACLASPARSGFVQASCHC